MDDVSLPARQIALCLQACLQRRTSSIVPARDRRVQYGRGGMVGGVASAVTDRRSTMGRYFNDDDDDEDEKKKPPEGTPEDDSDEGEESRPPAPAPPLRERARQE